MWIPQGRYGGAVQGKRAECTSHALYSRGGVRRSLAFAGSHRAPRLVTRVGERAAVAPTQVRLCGQWVEAPAARADVLVNRCPGSGRSPLGTKKGPSLPCGRSKGHTLT